MIKQIKIDENTSLTLSGNVGWTMEYMSQFGHDIVPDLMPVLGAILELLEGMADTGMSVKEAKDAVKILANGSATTALVELSGLRMVDIIGIIWAMAKDADPDIEPPRQWVKQFDVFPFDVIIPEAFMLVAQSSMSSKNWTRLWTATKSLQAPKAKQRKKRQASTTSSSPESKED